MLRLAIILIVAAVALAGCASPERADQPGGNQTAPPSPTPGPAVGGNLTTPAGNASAGAGEVVDAHMVDNAFQPDNLQIEAGQGVRFSNMGSVLHSVTIQKDGALLQQEDRDVAPGDNAVVTLPEPGLYKLRCKYHSADYDTAGTMIGRITVS